MNDVVRLALLVLVIAAVAALARRVRVAAPILLVAAGVALSFVPGIPMYELDPEVVLVLILPPLLYSAAWRTSLPALRSNLRPIGLLSIGLVLFTTVLVGLVLHALVPAVPLVAALALGAIVAPPDAVAATAVARATGLPRRIVTILEGESLLNDATALVALSVAASAVAGVTITVGDAAWRFLLAAGGGALIGLALAWLVERLHRRITDPLLDVTLTLVTPFAAYVAAEQIHASGVVAVVITGLRLANRPDRYLTPASRVASAAVWELAGFLLEGGVFLLIGLQIRSILPSVGADAGTAAIAALGVLATVVLSRFVWVFPATYLPRLIPSVARRDSTDSWRDPFVISWAGMRGVVSLAAAFALPADFPQRDLLLVVTLTVIVGTLVVQGLSLPALIRRLRIPGPDPHLDALAEAAAAHEAGTAALQRLDDLVAAEGAVAPDVVETLRAGVEKRRNAAWERLGRETGRETPSAAYRRLRRAMIAAEREVLFRLRDARQVDDDLLRRGQHDLDLEETLLSGAAADDAAPAQGMSGAGTSPASGPPSTTASARRARTKP